MSSSQNQMLDTEVANFSFRMFDMYRRFVESLQINPDYLAEFKTGIPCIETCKRIIKNSFQHRQTEERMQNLIAYLQSNALIIAHHADNVPSNWQDAIKYTNDYIKLVRRILQKKGVAIKTFCPDDKIVNELGNYIASLLHSPHPTEVQLQAVKDYLMHDLKNPKRNILSMNTPKTDKNKKKGNLKKFKFESTPMQGHNNHKIKVTIRKVPKQKPQSQSNVSSKNNSESVNNEVYQQQQQKTGEQNVPDHPPEYSTISCDLLSRKVAQFDPASPDNGLLFDETANSAPNWINGVYKIPQRQNIAQHPSIESIKSILQNPYYDFSVEEIKKTPIKVEGGETVLIKNEPTDDSQNLKRKMSFSSNKQVKKFATPSSVNSQNDEIRVSNNCHNDNSVLHQNMIDEVNINNVSFIESEFVKKEIGTPNETSKNAKKLSYLLENIKKECTCNKCKNPLNYLAAESLFVNTECSIIKNMAYSEAQWLIGAVLDFCLYKKETSIEEILVLRRTHDLMKWRSLKEN